MNDTEDRTEDRTRGISANGVPTGSARILVAALREASIISGHLGVRVDGRRSGTIYLSNGEVTGADSSGTPDLRSRLLGAGLVADHPDFPATRSPATRPSAAPSSAAVREDLRRRIADGSVAVTDVASVALSATLDATQSLLETMDDAPARVSIHPGEQAAHGIDHHVPVETLLAAASERAARCRRLAVDADQPVALRHLGRRRSGASVDSTAWQLVTRLDGRHTPRELARAAGTELYATLLQLDRLATAGLCTTVRRVPVPTRSPEMTTQRPAPPLRVTFDRITGPAEWADDLSQAAPTDPDLIQRLITGLRALS